MTIKELRVQAGMSQQAFADYLHIPKHSIENWESERRVPPSYLPELIEAKLIADGKIKAED